MKFSNQFQIAFQMFSECLLNLPFLTSVSFFNCSLQYDSCINNFFHSNSNLVNLTLTGGHYENIQEISLFWNVNVIDFSDSNLSSTSLFSSFKSISNSEKSPSKLMFDGLKIDENSWFNIYSELPNLTFNNLKCISWSKNSMSFPNAQHFHHFLKSNTSISEIRLSMSYQLNESEHCLSDLASVLQKNSISSLTLRGGGQFVYGSKINPVLEAFANVDDLKNLDINFQKIEDLGFDYLKNVVSKK
jgi:hypothetical protein